MQRRGLRLTLLFLLFATGAGAGYLAFDALRQIAGGLGRERDVSARLERLSAAAATLRAAHGAYVAPGQPRAEWLARASAALQLLRDEAAMLRPRMRSAAAPQGLDLLEASVRSIEAADTAAREHLGIGEELMASDLLYAEARPAFDALFTGIHDLHAAERAAVDDERRALIASGGIALGAWALAWGAGLVGLAGLPRQAPVAPAAATAIEPPAATPSVPDRPSVDIGEAAAVCTELSRLTTTDGLPDLLARTARILDAPGLVVWLGAGEELFAAASHGYEARVIGRLGPIRRQDDNATAAAWRTGELRIVPAGPIGNGAIVAPLFGPAGSIGVLAADVRGGREADGPTRAVATMIAAQLGAVVAAWPPPSAVERPAPRADGGPAETRAAASA